MQTKKVPSDRTAGLTELVFPGFSAWVFEWFAGLERDNSREYFRATRERYEVEVRGALTLMLQELTGTFGGSVRVFRQQNDMRFSPAVPYKTRTYGVLDFTTPVKPRLYADISAHGLYSGTGYHRLAPDQLSRYRSAVFDDQVGARLAATLITARDSGLELITDSLTAVPRGYPRDHPRAELLKARSLLAGRLRTGATGISRHDAIEQVAGAWRAAAALTSWLGEHVGPSTLPPRERWPRRPEKPPGPGLRGQEAGEPTEIQRPSVFAVDTVTDRVPTVAVTLEIPVLELDPCAVGGLGDESHLDLARLREIGLDAPLRVDIPADHDSVGRLLLTDRSCQRAIRRRRSAGHTCGLHPPPPEDT